MVERALKNSKISIKYKNTVIKNIIGNKESGVESIEIEDVNSKKSVYSNVMEFSWQLVMCPIQEYLMIV